MSAPALTPFTAHLEAMWHSTASKMSYYRADDSGKEWRHASDLRPLLLEVERQLKEYGRPRPNGSKYLLAHDDRIEWECAA